MLITQPGAIYERRIPAIVWRTPPPKGRFRILALSMDGTRPQPFWGWGIPFFEPTQPLQLGRRALVATLNERRHEGSADLHLRLVVTPVMVGSSILTQEPSIAWAKLRIALVT